MCLEPNHLHLLWNLFILKSKKGAKPLFYLHRFSDCISNYNVACPGSQLQGVFLPTCIACNTLSISCEFLPADSG